MLLKSKILYPSKLGEESELDMLLKKNEITPHTASKFPFPRKI
jgi:hypothetical protein